MLSLPWYIYNNNKMFRLDKLLIYLHGVQNYSLNCKLYLLLYCDDLWRTNQARLPLNGQHQHYYCLVPQRVFCSNWYLMNMSDSELWNRWFYRTFTDCLWWALSTNHQIMIKSVFSFDKLKVWSGLAAVRCSVWVGPCILQIKCTRKI